MNSDRTLGAVSRGLTAIGGVALLTMALWTVVDIITRYAFAKPIRGSIDLVESALVLVVFLALPECFYRDEQITVDVVDHVAGARTVAGLKLLGSLCTLVFLILLGCTGIQPTLDAFQFGDRKPDLPIPIFALLAVIEMAILASIVILASKFFTQVGRALQGDTP